MDYTVQLKVTERKKKKKTMNSFTKTYFCLTRVKMETIKSFSANY